MVGCVVTNLLVPTRIFITKDIEYDLHAPQSSNGGGANQVITGRLYMSVERKEQKMCGLSTELCKKGRTG